MESQDHAAQQHSKLSETTSKVQEKKQETKIHKGVYINNQRRKGRGGRIKSNSIDLKIEVNERVNALHQSEVEWIQIRRYVKGQKKPQEPKQKYHPKQSYKQKQSGTKYHVKDNDNDHGNKKKHFNGKYTEKEDKKKINTKISQQKPIQQEQQKKYKKRYKLKKQQQVKTEQLKVQKQLAELSLDAQKKQQKEEEKERQQQGIKWKGQQQQNKQQKKESNQAQNKIKQQQAQLQKQNQEQSPVQKPTQQVNAQIQEQQQKQKEVVVAKIVKQLKNVYKEKQFVGLLYAQQKYQKNKKYKNKNKSEKVSVFDDFFQLFTLRVYPLHSRLEVMQIQDNPQNRQKVRSLLKKQKLNQEKIKRSDLIEALETNYVLLKFDKWVKDIPIAEIIKFVGKINTIDGECSAFLHQYGLNDFDHEQQDNTPLEIEPTQFHIPYKKMVFTIDPKTSMDLDDALSIQPTENPQIFEIGIHISDVSTYLHKINRDQLIKRSTSVYLPHRVYHMLPRPLMNVCSLNPQVQRLAFSIFVKMNVKGEVIGQSRLQKNIITSRYKLDYETAQDILTKKINYDQFNEKRPSTPEEYIALTQKLQTMCIIGLAHRKQRILFDVFENKQVNFQLDQDNWPIDVTLQKRFTAKKLVEQFMIIGNVEAAKHLVKLNPNNALVIHHPPPSQLTITYFNEYFKQLGINIKFKNSKQTQMQLLQIQKRQDIDEQVKKVCFFKARRCQQKANYKLYSDIFDEDETKLKEQSMLEIDRTIHFALDQQYYTHFTSPMRRMADILVHEALNIIVMKNKPNQIPDNEIQRINFGRTATTRLKRDIVDLYICLLIKRTEKQFQLDGVVVSYGLQSISIYIPMFDNIKQILWRRQLNISKIQKLQKKKSPETKSDINKKQKPKPEDQQMRAWLYYDRKDQRKDIYWNVKKFTKVKMLIDSTRDAPYRMKITLLVNTNKGQKKIFPHKDFD